MTSNLAKIVLFGLPKSYSTTLKTLKVKPDVLKKFDLSIRLPSTNTISLYNSYKIPNFHHLILANFIPFPHARHALFYRSIHILGKNSEKIGGHV
jgi:hypothetical protein